MPKTDESLKQILTDATRALVTILAVLLIAYLIRHL